MITTRPGFPPGRFFGRYPLTDSARAYSVHTHISAGHRLFDLKLGEGWRYRDLIVMFTRRSFTVAYKQTILGPLWQFINPLLTSVIYVIVFGNIAKLGTDGVPQLLFYLGGTAVWSFFSSSLTNNAGTFTGNAGLFGKVYFPRLTIPVSNVLSCAIRFGIQMIMVVILMAYYLIRHSLTVQPLFWLLVPLLLVWLGVMGMGCGIIVSSMTTKYRDLSVLVGFGMQLWMYATPVVYPLSTLSGPLRTIVLINPATAPIELFRRALFGVGTFVPWSAAISLAFTLAAAFFGIVIFNRVERTFMDTV